VNALIALFRLGAAQMLAQRLFLAGLLATLSMLVMVFDAIFRATPFSELAGRAGDGVVTHESMTWYVAITETVIFSGAHLFREVQSDIREGRLGALLLLPLAYPWQKLAEWLGSYTVRLLLLGVPMLGLAFLLTGTVPMPLWQIPLVLISVLAAAPIALAAHFFIGCACLWVKASEPIYWLWQKSNFVLGGLFFPLLLYPPLLGKLALATPFPALLYVPARFVFQIGPSRILQGFALQAAWGAAMMLLAFAAYRAVLRRIGREGD
jgi:ABC-2 type transport system permease protein